MSQPSFSSKLPTAHLRNAKKRRTKEQPVTTNNDTNDTPDTSDSSMTDVTEHTSESALEIGRKARKLKGKLKKLERIKLHFDKTSSGYKFENTAQAYNTWVIRMRVALDRFGLLDTIKVDTDGTELQNARQKTAWHMIALCVPDSVLPTVTVSATAVDWHGDGVEQADVRVH